MKSSRTLDALERKLLISRDEIVMDLFHRGEISVGAEFFKFYSENLVQDPNLGSL